MKYPPKGGSLQASLSSPLVGPSFATEDDGRVHSPTGGDLRLHREGRSTCRVLVPRRTGDGFGHSSVAGTQWAGGDWMENTGNLGKFPKNHPTWVVRKWRMQVLSWCFTFWVRRSGLPHHEAVCVGVLDGCLGSKPPQPEELVMDSLRMFKTRSDFWLAP